MGVSPVFETSGRCYVNVLKSMICNAFWVTNSSSTHDRWTGRGHVEKSSNGSLAMVMKSMMCRNHVTFENIIKRKNYLLKI